jgi:hypothetical protein
MSKRKTTREANARARARKELELRGWKGGAGPREQRLQADAKLLGWDSDPRRDEALEAHERGEHPDTVNALLNGFDPVE